VSSFKKLVLAAWVDEYIATEGFVEVLLLKCLVVISGVGVDRDTSANFDFSRKHCLVPHCYSDYSDCSATAV